jgi:hypothetical protein
LTLIAALAMFALGVPGAAQDLDWGIRAGFYDDVGEPFVGGELLTRIRTSDWYFNPNLEWVFVDDGDLATLNADIHYDWLQKDDFTVWLGGGLALIFEDTNRPSDDERDLGVNLLAGAMINPRGVIRPYVQGKIILADDSEAVIGVGLRF